MTTVDPFGLPPEEALRWFREKGLKPTFDWRDMWAREHASAFTVAKAMQLDVLADLQQGVADAIEQGQSLAQFRKGLRPLLTAKGWWGEKEQTDPVTGETKLVQLGSAWRLRTIYHTNLTMAHAAGRWERIVRTSDARPWLRYVAITGDGRTRDEHLHWHGTILRWDDPWWKIHYPPNGWGCRCKVMQLSDRDLARYGFKVTEFAPGDEMLSWYDSRNRMTRQVPRGIDPGFDYNVGEARGPRSNSGPGAEPEPKPLPAENAVGLFKRLEGDPSSPEYKAALQRQRALLVGMPHELDADSARELIAVTGAKVSVELARKYPKVVAALQKLEVTEWSSQSVKDQVKHLSRIDPRVLHRIAHEPHYTPWKGVFIGAKRLPWLDELSHLSGMHPRGWPEDATWDEVGGAGGSDQAAVSVIGASGSYATALHELGHSLGFRVPVAGRPAHDHPVFVEHHKRMFPKLDKYEQQDGPGADAGRQEMFAESIAVLHTSTESEFDSKYDAEYRRWLTKLLQHLAQ